jgi:class 3 adenylate cyclase
MLELSWNVLCPLCRGTKESSTSLKDMSSRVHCGVCHIDVDVNFDRFVEVTFRPGPRLRPVEVGEFCVGGPGLTPHIVAQQLLPPGATRTLSLPLEEGRYRLRTLALPGGQLITVASDGAPRAALRAAEDGWPDGEACLSTRPVLRYENVTRGEQLFVLERMTWSDQATTAAEVTALQSFRDLFAGEALRPGQEISVGSLAVLFTDLRDSTRLYRHIGDAPAFGLVMEHFDVLREAIAAEDGAVVKTIGDAVMAVFRQPAAALRATLQAQRRLASPGEGRRPLLLKAGIHCGPCIAVTLNERLDYFGSTINIAARLAGLSSGADVVLSSPVRDDPDVEAWLRARDSGLRAEPMEATLKGLDDERFTLWRVTPAATAGDAAVPR